MGRQHHSKVQDFHFSGCLEAVCNLRLGAIWDGTWWNVIPAYSLTRFQHSFWNRTTYWIFLQALCVIFSAAGRTARDCPRDSDGSVRCCRMRSASTAESHHSSLNAVCKIYNLQQLAVSWWSAWYTDTHLLTPFSVQDIEGQNYIVVMLSCSVFLYSCIPARSFLCTDWLQIKWYWTTSVLKLMNVIEDVTIFGI